MVPGSGCRLDIIYIHDGPLRDGRLGMSELKDRIKNDTDMSNTEVNARKQRLSPMI